MKRLVALVLSVLMLLSLLACAAEPEVVPEPEPIPAPAPEPVPLPEPEPEPEPELALLSYETNELEFHDLILSLSVDIRYNLRDENTLDLFYTDDDLPTSRLMKLDFRVTEDTAKEFFGLITSEPYGDMEITVINNKDGFIQYYSDGSFVIALFMGNNNGYAMNLSANVEDFDFYLTYFLEIIHSVQEVEVEPEQRSLLDIANDIVGIAGGEVNELDDMGKLFWTVLYDAEDVIEIIVEPELLVDPAFAKYILFLFSDIERLENAKERFRDTFDDGGYAVSGYILLTYAYEFAVRHTIDDMIAAFLTVMQNESDSETTSDTQNATQPSDGYNVFTAGSISIEFPVAPFTASERRLRASFDLFEITGITDRGDRGYRIDVRVSGTLIEGETNFWIHAYDAENFRIDRTVLGRSSVSEGEEFRFTDTLFVPIGTVRIDFENRTD